jgi:simple sugar transport system substrate-binding protein
VIYVDRKADVPEEYYATFIGSDFCSGRQECRHRTSKLMGEKGNIIDLEGTVGAGRPLTARRVLMMKWLPIIMISRSSNPNLVDFNLPRERSCPGFDQEIRKQVHGIYAHNDEMALGAIQAVEEAGMKPGTEIRLSPSMVKKRPSSYGYGKLNVTVECSPCLDLNSSKQL